MLKNATFNFGESLFKKGDNVIDLIIERLPVSSFSGALELR